VLLTVETSGSSGTAHSEIADAGGRFLIDMELVGSVKTEGMRCLPLAVEPTASVVRTVTFTCLVHEPPMNRLLIYCRPQKFFQISPCDASFVFI